MTNSGAFNFPVYKRQAHIVSNSNDDSILFILLGVYFLRTLLWKLSDSRFYYLNLFL